MLFAFKKASTSRYVMAVQMQIVDASELAGGRRLLKLLAWQVKSWWILEADIPLTSNSL